MKAVQVLFDENLLRRLDADAEVRADGRSAVLRRAADEYLRRRRAKRTSEAYRRAYGKARAGTGDEYAGWPDEGAWPVK
jgi:metal-responsive CopG/Arc/MetJ family transcriptional regulator